jgi:peptidyl-prolyl cis-trans isomerase B (cyclophilin B)
MVRLEALRGVGAYDPDAACGSFAAAVADRETRVALVAIDGLAACGHSPAAVALLEKAASALPDGESPREWHRAAHGLVALAAARPESALALLDTFTSADSVFLRLYAARAAAILKHRSALEGLAADADDNVVEAAVVGLSRLVGHAADDIYRRALGRRGSQVIRAATMALDETPARDEAVRALEGTLARIATDPATSREVIDLIAATLGRLGVEPRVPRRTDEAESVLDAAALRRLAAPRARIRIQDVGSVELALFTAEAPATVLRFATLAEAGRYDGLVFHRVLPNLVARAGSPDGSEYGSLVAPMRDELGLWPHVRGAVALASRGRDTGSGQFFVDLVDNPRFDHEYTVFAQVLNGMDTIDRILEGDVIERIEIIP